MKEISVEDEAIVQAITIFIYLQKTIRFKGNSRFVKELDWLKNDLEILKNSEEKFGAGTKLISSDRMWTVSTYDKEGKSVGESKILSLELTKYLLFSEILGAASLDGETYTSLNHFGRTVKYNKILTDIDNAAADKTIKNNLFETINNLNQLRNRQTYVTSNDGHKSFNRVTDMMFKKSLVCFDATADINEVYNLRAEHYKDIFKLPRIEGVRDYSNVTMYTTMTRTGRRGIDINVASSVLKSVTLGEKTLIVTHKQNEAFFEEVAKSVYPEKTIAIAHWGAITGLNNWKNFDTCIIVGLNHKSRSYAQNRVIINTLDEKKAFGNEQNDLNNSIESSVILSEIIQAINRIRVRKVTNSSGGCDKANIYITIPNPKYNDYPYKKLIKAQMPNIDMTVWNLKSEIVYEGGAGHLESIIDYLEGNLTTKGGTRLVKDVRDALGIKAESYRDLIGKDSAKQEKFKKKIGLHGFDIIDVFEEGTRGRLKKKPTKYFHKI